MENGAVCVEIAYEAAGVDRIYQRSSNSLRSVLVQLCFDFYMIESRPENLIGYRAYDSDALDEELRQEGIEMIAPHRSNRVKSVTQDRRKLRRYQRRWLIERFSPGRVRGS
jgi:hypothetical protein